MISNKAWAIYYLYIYNFEKEACLSQDANILIKTKIKQDDFFFNLDGSNVYPILKSVARKKWLLANYRKENVLVGVLI